jgi:hypothetical protein
MGILQGFPFRVKVSAMTIEGGLMGAQDLKLMMVLDILQLLPLQQLPLQLLHISRPLADLECACNEVLLLLDDSVGLGLD